MSQVIAIRGRIVSGYRIASGLNTEGVIGPNGIPLTDSLRKQRPFFEKEIPGFKNVWTGTINMSVAPRMCKMLQFDHTITCEWQPGITETFGIVEGVTITAKEKRYPGYIYYPMPSEVHIPREDIIELVAPKIEGLAYGDEIEIEVSPRKIEILEKN